MRRSGAVLGLVAMLTACGGDSGGGGRQITVVPTPTPGTTGPVSPTPTPTPVATAGCSLRERQDWAAGVLREWYLFPETLPASLDPTPYGTVDDYIDALTATARAQRRDRYFTYNTSIREEEAYYNSGASAGYGMRLALDQNYRLYSTESFEGAPALNAGIDRGTEIVGLGTSTANVRSVTSIISSGGIDALIDALGPDTPGTTRYMQVNDAAGMRTVAVTKSDFELLPVSTRYGAKVITDGGERVGYVNLRTFITTANSPLRTAFASFKSQGISKVIVDFRYNGGGLVSVAELMGDLMGGGRAPGDVFNYTTFRPEKSENNSVKRFEPVDQSITPTRIAFIGMEGTASASELVMNAFVPYLHANAGLIGTNTYGKPVGQIAIDRSGCDDRLRVIAFALQNGARQGEYFNGLAGTMEATCQASDDIGYQLGDPRESSTRSALDFLAGRSCTPIGSAGASASTSRSIAGRLKRQLLTRARPTTAQREVPGLF